MPRDRKPTDPNIRIAKTLTGSRPTPSAGPLARQQQGEAELKQIEARLAAIKAAAGKDTRK